jgi:hypothetical protein
VFARVRSSSWGCQTETISREHLQGRLEDGADASVTRSTIVQPTATRLCADAPFGRETPVSFSLTSNSRDAVCTSLARWGTRTTFGGPLVSKRPHGPQ